MTATAARLEARLLGGFDLRVDGHVVDLPSRPARSLFAYLIMTAGTMHRREKLAAMFWPDADDEKGRSYLRHALWRIRKPLVPATSTDGQFILADELSVGFDPTASYWLDVLAFERDEEGAADLYRGELLPGVHDDWAVLERERLEAVLPARMQRRIDRLSADGRWPEVIERAERWIAFGGVPESAYRALMIAHNELGDRAGVATAYRRCVDALERELDVAPSDQTRRLFESISTRPAVARPEPAVRVTSAPQVGAGGTDVPPFKGLRHFDESDAEIFFGRDAVIARIVERSRSTSFLALIGASGSGKSSILRAGVIPAIRAGTGREIHVITPTAQPLEALAVGLTTLSGSIAPTAALLDDLARDPRSLRLHLRRGGSPPLLVVDQLEELFTMCRDAFQREAFLDNLLGAALPSGEASATVVIALRADFYAHCADHEGLRDAVAQHQEYIGPMSARELREAIERPTADGGWSLEPGLADTLLDDVGDEPGALPLLSHALLETWLRRRGRILTLEGYAAAGRVRGAIARTAESVHARLSAEDQQLARRIFLRLTEFGEGTQDTRRRATREELATGSRDATGVDAVIGVLADARLVTTSRDGVEVAHEALIREWPRLRQWLDEDRETLRAHRELTRSAREWERLGHDVGVLYRGVRLVRATELERTAAEELNDIERRFIAASRELAEREEREREAARQRELEAAQRLAATERAAAVRLRQRALYLVIALFFLTGMAGAAVYFAEQARASAAATELEQRRAFVESARVAAVNVDSRIDSLADAVGVDGVRGELVYLLETADPRLPEALRTIQYFAGDIVVLFIANYATNELLALPFSTPEMRERAERARGAVASLAPDHVEGCRRLQVGPAEREEVTVAYQHAPVRRSRPYRPAAGDAPSIAMTKFGQPCRAYALVAEVSLRRAGEWMAAALASGDDAYLVDDAGRLLAQARRADPAHLRDLREEPVVGPTLASRDALLRETTDPLDGRTWLAATVPVDDTGWRVVVVRSTSATQRKLEADLAQVRSLGAILAVLLIAASAGALIVRRRSAPS